MLEHLLVLTFVASSTPAFIDAGIHLSSSACKPKYGSPNWPPPAAWQQLNESVSGRLVSPTPPGAVCHPLLPGYDNASCNAVLGQWPSTDFHAHNLVSTDHNDVACLPDSTYPCCLESYPRFVVSAVNAQDVQSAVSFARDTGVRLIVKGTGHDVPGRSSGSDSLSVQTHNIRGLSLDRDDARASALGGVASIKIHTGERMMDIYNFAAANDLTVVGGGDLHVGIGGWISYAGHGPVSAYYDLGADQVLEMEVATADGVLRTVNETADADLFWALRGGGAMNFAVIVSVTVKAYDILPYTSFIYAYNTTADSETFWTMVAHFHNELPQLVKSGLMGYFWVVPSEAAANNTIKQGRLYGDWFAPHLSLDQVRHRLAPFEEKLANLADNVANQGHGMEYADFMKWYAANSTLENAGVPVRLGSRLLDEQALSQPVPKLKDALRRTNDKLTGLPILGHVIVGPGTCNPIGGIMNGSSAVLPAWRTAYMQMGIPRSWEPLNERTLILPRDFALKKCTRFAIWRLTQAHMPTRPTRQSPIGRRSFMARPIRGYLL